jgi:hypothetical protein
MKLEYPLSDAMPSTTNARDRLLAKIFQFRKDAVARRPSQTQLNQPHTLNMRAGSPYSTSPKSVRHIPHHESGESDNDEGLEIGGDGDGAGRSSGKQANGDNKETEGESVRAPEGEMEAQDEDFALLYAYALVTGQLSLEIETLRKEIEGLFGIMDEDLLRLE